MSELNRDLIIRAAGYLQHAKHGTAFTGAGISVESGIPPFRGKGGLWNRINPALLEIDYFRREPKKAWELLKKLFYEGFGNAQPNKAHFALSAMESAGFLQSVITQNIDHLHQDAGSRHVFEYHGTYKILLCTNCDSRFPVGSVSLDSIPPFCPYCSGILKPDFVFFGEPIPEPTGMRSFIEGEKSDVMLVIGSTGEVHPASLIPRMAKQNGAKIIEVNTQESTFTADITDLFLKGKATVVMHALSDELGLKLNS